MSLKEKFKLYLKSVRECMRYQQPIGAASSLRNIKPEPPKYRDIPEKNEHTIVLDKEQN